MVKKDLKQSASLFLQKALESPMETKFKESFETTKPAVMSGFRGMFGDMKLSDQEKFHIQALLNDYAPPNTEKDTLKDKLLTDFHLLSLLTAEIKAINNQSILLHGERIKKVQELLFYYKEGAFSQWLIHTYGNRQTPYSMLYYYEFYHTLPVALRSLVERIPKKAAYILASRQGSLDKKIEIIQRYQGEKQATLISSIRAVFPLLEKDKRASMPSSLLDQADLLLIKLEKYSTFTGFEKQKIRTLIQRLQKLG